MGSRATGWAPLWLGVALATGLLWPESARAQGTDPLAEELANEEADVEEGKKRPAAEDERGGHWLVQGRFGLAAPFGSIATDLPAGSVVATGLAFGGSVGFGLGRAGVLEASGTYARLPGASRCDGCSGTSIDLGLGLVYHLAQGLAFDPWISYGVGYRRAAFAGSTQTPRGRRSFDDGGVFHGLDVARVGFGGDFYPVPLLGFGPFLEFDFGTYLGRPGVDPASEQPRFGRTVYGFFQAGVRIALDPVPRGRRPAAKATAGGPARRPVPRAGAAPQAPPEPPPDGIRPAGTGM